MKVHHFVFNPYQVNSFVLSDDSGECLIIDPSCGSHEEQQQFADYIIRHGLKPVLLVNTHGHFDHIIGNAFVVNTFAIPTAIHQDDVMLLENAWKQGEIFGYEVEAPPKAAIMLEDEGVVRFGNSELRVRHTPGHSPGSVVLYAPEDGFLFVGDVLFRGSIGRTDLYLGDYDELMDSIAQKVLVYPPETRVYSGHGPFTTIAQELQDNPFLIRLGS